MACMVLGMNIGAFVETKRSNNIYGAVVALFGIIAFAVALTTGR